VKQGIYNIFEEQKDDSWWNFRNIPIDKPVTKGVSMLVLSRQRDESI